MKNNNLIKVIGLIGSLLLTPGYAEDGVTATEIIIGGVMDLEGRSSGLGLGMKAGIEAAFKDQIIAGRKLRFVAANDSYTPEKAVAATKNLIEQKVLLFA
ncbi:MAG: ABC transporter substrate-binding protein, partial [Thiothrix sp.]